MAESLVCILIGGYLLAHWGVKRSNAQDEFEEQQAQRLVELSSRYDYRTNMFRP